jgi:hypothetical protein
MKEDPWLWPIIYVRGYAMTSSEIDETTADPFCGFNIGSTVIRATPDPKTPPRKFIFESPLVRLSTDYGYTDVYQDGLDIVDVDFQGEVRTKSVVIYRYYDSSSTQFGDGKTKTIREFAQGLDALIIKLRDLVCANPENEVAKKDFRCYLVAHSMGGLVCRAFLQNDTLGSKEARACVDKYFTYATPHNGIEMAGINVPQWLGANDINNFNRWRTTSTSSRCSRKLNASTGSRKKNSRRARSSAWSVPIAPTTTSRRDFHAPSPAMAATGW